MFGSIGWKIVAIQAVLMLLMIGAAYWYWNWSQDRIATLAGENSQLLMATQTQEQTIQYLRDSAQNQATQMTLLQQSLADAERDRRSMEGRLRRMNLQLMARNNAADLENQINASTRSAFAEIERITSPTGRIVPSSTPPAAQPADNSQPPPRPPVRTRN